MERTGTSAERLIDLVRRRTGRHISRTMLSYLLTGSRRCSAANAGVLSEVTGVPFEVLMRWSKVSATAKKSGRRSRTAA